MAAGLVTQLPDPVQDIDDDPDDQPIEIAGEPLSQTIVASAVDVAVYFADSSALVKCLSRG